MKRRATIIDIARAAGVSKSTVSLVLTSPEKVNPTTADAVRGAMRDLDYIYNRGAAGMRSSRSRVVGMVINDLSNPFFAELAIGIEHGLRASGAIPFLANTSESLSRQAEVIRSMREHGAAGIVLCPAIGTDAQEVGRLAALGMPLVLAIRRIPGATVPLVASDNRAGAAAAVRHLVGRGHTRIAFAGGRIGMGNREDRLAGYADAHRSAGLPIDPALAVEAAPTKDGGVAAMTALLSGPERPTAVLCFNDVVAIGATLALTRRGLQVGRDVAVVGFDDTTEAQLMSPPLTTVSVAVGALGERAAQVLLRQIEGTAGVPDTYIGEARLVVRESCGSTMITREVA